MNEYAGYTKLDRRNIRRNSNFTVENLIKSGISEEDATKVLMQNMSKVQLMTELGVSQISVPYVYSQYITMEKLLDVLDVDNNYATMVIETFNLVGLFQKYGLNQNGLKKINKNEYSFEAYHPFGFSTFTKKNVTGYINFAKDSRNLDMSFVFIGQSSTLSINYKDCNLCITYKYNDNYVFGFDTTVELDTTISLPITEGNIPVVYKETKPVDFSSTSVTRRIVLDSKMFLKLLNNIEKLDEFIYAYNSDSLEQYFDESSLDNIQVSRQYYYQAD